eukprot:CAMPEP_0114334618 /NCGR_PEP_ID=MMETSP0101-20121206/4505_1 /TAXON_ID=38822 ORGANISM="Pteridomonas danica, Strain PT" /NCGR_SAMPLE_ID=MMETSP0101 /ASSEMBLY_ACC=CAM_ASM_000211 /LENGTH=245 /DNA_ID=CAMNT_0001465957 /DNA_START=361 /DNA_END=1095 /DNA_ORIENTATION=-
MGDPIGRPSLLEAVPKIWAQTGLHPVGRLDADTSGLLIFSSDGKVTQQLLDPNVGVEREYVATVEGDAMDKDLKEKLGDGVETTLGKFRADLIEQTENTVRVVVTEGKHRMVRRMLANVGLPVMKLHRSRYGNICLDTLAIKEGEHCEVPETCTQWARSLLDIKLRKKQGMLSEDKQPLHTNQELSRQELSDPDKALEEALGMKDREIWLKSHTLKKTDWQLTAEEELAELDPANLEVYTGPDYV